MYIIKLGVRMRMMPRAAPCQCVRRTTVESNMKASIIYTWLVKTLHNVLSSFEIFVVLIWLLLYIDFAAFSFSASPTVG